MTQDPLGLSAGAADPDGVVGRLALLLASGADLAEALALVVQALDLHSAVLRTRAPHTLLAVAGEVVHAVPSGRTPVRAALDPGTDLLLHRPDGSPELVLTVVGARPAVSGLLQACAAVLALAAPTLPDEDVDVPSLLALADDALDAAADALHDGPAQDLLAARWALDLAARSGDPLAAVGQGRAALGSATTALREAMFRLRPRADLGEALTALAARPAGAALELDVDRDAAAALAPAAAALLYRLVQAATPAAGARLVLRREAGVVVLLLDGAELPDPVAWRTRLRALGGDLGSAPGRLRATLPTSPVPPDAKACS